jgi:PiT family inorganic phosphate transporter
MFRIISGILLGWGLGANDSANIFGTAVSSRMIRYSTAVILAAIFILLGAILQGAEGMRTISGLSEQNLNSAFITSTAAAITVIVLTFLKLPISTSQAVVGAIIGSSFYAGTAIDTGALLKIIISWIGTPIGGFLFSIVFYHLFHRLLYSFKPTLIATDSILRTSLILAGCYGAYALGANNVANVTGVYAGNLLTIPQAVVIGGLSIAVGVLTYSKNVMLTIGRGIIPLDALSALVTVVAHAVTVHIYAMIGVPVSSSQAIVGAVVGIGFVKNIEAINIKLILKVFSGWMVTPISAGTIAFFLTFLTHLKLD